MDGIVPLFIQCCSLNDDLKRYGIEILIDSLGYVFVGSPCLYFRYFVIHIFLLFFFFIHIFIFFCCNQV